MSDTSGAPPRMDIKDFRDGGYLQEVNRRFFHPLGLALAVRVPEQEGEPWSLDGIYDARDDPEGWYFDALSEADVSRARKVEAELQARSAVRLRKRGYVIQPLEPVKP